MSTIETNKVKPISGSSTLTLGESGDTVSLGSGASSSGFAPAGVSSASTSGTALQITSGNIVGAGSDAANADLGAGIHIKTADSGASVDATSDELVIEGSGSSGMTILSGTSGEGGIKFGDSGDNDAGRIVYDHSGDDMLFLTSGNTQLTITDDGRGLSQFTAKAWCTANGTGTPSIIDSHNISSLSDHETGQLGMNFANSMANSNYTVIVNAWQGYAYTFGGMDMSTSTFKATCSNGSSYTDVNRVHGLVFGD